MEMGVSYPIYLSFSLSPTLPYSDYKLVKALISAKSFTELLKSFNFTINLKKNLSIIVLLRVSKKFVENQFITLA